ncbi:ABC transporter substrate-binding protein [Propionivibrio sp.]|uniref:ABC transporter substrate-binding protein n=1 Tax=Propionivibrio sp. TaxID=2212460 RepID=UPI00263524F0|nr:ABC transporter substrate-binding protein [Propionivibrio sp.]
MLKLLKLAALFLTLLPFAGQSLASGELIVIGQVAPFSGPLAPTGTHLRSGAQLYFDSINASGGVNGRKIRLVTVDDGYQASETVRQAKLLISEEKPVALFGTVGTGNVELLLSEKVLVNAGVPLVTVRTGGSALAKGNNPWLFITRASYADEIAAFLELYSKHGYQNYAVLFQNDAFGLDVMSSVEELIGKHNGKIVVKASYEKNTTEVAAAVKTIIRALPQAVILIANTAAASEFIKQSREAGSLAMFYVMSTVDAAQLVQRIGNKLAYGTVITQVVPGPENGLVPIAREVMDLFAKFKPVDVRPNHTFLEGYLGAKILVEGLRRAGPNPTGKKLRDTLEQIKDYDAGGVSVNFSPSRHLGVDFVDINIIGRDGRLIR